MKFNFVIDGQLLRRKELNSISKKLKEQLEILRSKLSKI